MLALFLFPFLYLSLSRLFASRFSRPAVIRIYFAGYASGHYARTLINWLKRSVERGIDPRRGHDARDGYRV